MASTSQPLAAAQNPARRAGSGASTTTRRPGLGVVVAGIEDAELVALGIGQHDPRHVLLPTSAGEAPAATSRWTQVAWCSSERALRSRWIRFLPTLGSSTRTNTSAMPGSPSGGSTTFSSSTS